jgi:hypothetical protein
VQYAKLQKEHLQKSVATWTAIKEACEDPAVVGGGGGGDSGGGSVHSL